MYQNLLSALFPSRGRRAILQLLFCDGLTESVSALARRAGLTPRAAALAVKSLADVGLVKVESVGAADVARASKDHPAFPSLVELLKTAEGLAPGEAASSELRESLASFGAPLLGVAPRTRVPLSQAILDGLAAARKDATILRVLPLVLAKNAERLDWTELKEAARRRKLKSELGMLAELTGELSGNPALKERVRDLADKRRKRPTFFPSPRSRYEERLARKRTPPAARRWGFFMNMTEDSFRATLEKHRG